MATHVLPLRDVETATGIANGTGKTYLLSLRPDDNAALLLVTVQLREESFLALAPAIPECCFLAGVTWEALRLR
eukprot:10130971-Lingulodinium_polyedra.AAC.1